ncbi:hypothetical protein D3C81_2032390 [compost metagenome]
MPTFARLPTHELAVECAPKNANVTTAAPSKIRERCVDKVIKIPSSISTRLIQSTLARPIRSLNFPIKVELNVPRR